MYNSSKKSISKIVCIFLISSLLICTYSIFSSAYTEYVFVPITDFSIDMYVQEANQGGTKIYYNNTIETRGPMTIGGVVYYGIKNTDSNFGGTGKVHNCLTYKIQNLSLKDEYNIKFTTSIRQSIAYNVEVYLSDSSGQILAVLGYDSRVASSQVNLVTDFNFTLDGLNINTNQGTFLNVLIDYGPQYSANAEFLISSIVLTDLDDDTGFFESIINWIKNVVTSVTNGFTNLGNNISTWLTTLGNNISTWLTNVKDGIVNKLQSVQTAITNAIDGIQQWFVNLGNRIGEFFTMLKNYILYFQHPVTLNADGVPVDGNGNPVYTNPFDDTLQSVSDTLDDWFDSLDDFILTIQSVNVQITGYLQTFTNIFNRFNAGVPIIGVIITLALIVIVIKKIMGR